MWSHDGLDTESDYHIFSFFCHDPTYEQCEVLSHFIFEKSISLKQENPKV
jgi:hypothetical protein